MAIIVNFRVDDAHAQAFFEYAGYKARQIREPLYKVGSLILSSVNKQFQSEGVYMLGRQWWPLNDQYRREKVEEDGFPNHILWRTGKLWRAAVSRKSLTLRSVSQGVGYLIYHPVRWAEDEFGEVDLAALHMSGRGPTGYNHKGDPTGQMPARPFFVVIETGTTSTFQDDVERIFVNWLDFLRERNIRRGGPDVSMRPHINPLGMGDYMDFGPTSPFGFGGRG